MRFRSIFFIILVILTLIAVVDISRGGLQKIVNEMSQAVILPAPSGGTKALDDNWFDSSSP